MPKFVYDFIEGNKDLKDLLGGKGANLAEMTKLGLPVPPGFTITTDACQALPARTATTSRTGSTGRSPATSPSSRRAWGARSATRPTRCLLRSGASSRCPG